MELKPCPFCGSDKLKIDSKRTFIHDPHNKKRCSVTVRCMKCRARGPVVGILMPDMQYNETEICKEAVCEAWNRRATDETQTD